jgi:AmmeMemoRadiSam system protein A/AmmeMemoRadiSam system protein B
MPILGAFMVPHPPLIVKEIGKGKEQAITQTIEAYKEVARRVAALKPDTIVITTPHTIMYADYFHISPGYSAKGDFGQFGAAGVTFHVDYDEEFTSRLTDFADENDFHAGTLGEESKALDHATMVPLYFINQEYTEYKLVRIGLSGESYQAHYTLGNYIRKVSDDLKRNIVFIASGDLSHRLTEDGPYGYQKEGPEYDRKIMEIMSSADFMELFHFDESFCDRAAECGHRSFVIMAGALDRTAVKAEQLSYEGPFGVGYGICAYEMSGLDNRRNFGERYMEEYMKEMEARKESEDEYVRLARQSMEYYIINGRRLRTPDNLPNDLISKRAGTFVSIKKNGKLRGCIGTTAPVTGSIAEEIINNAISAATKDPRFSPIAEDELKDLVISVDVLGPTEPITSKEELDVKRYGVIVAKGRRRGLLLPNLEGVDTVEEQIAISKQKAGIDEDEEVTLERFEVIRHV